MIISTRVTTIHPLVERGPLHRDKALENLIAVSHTLYGILRQPTILATLDPRQPASSVPHQLLDPRHPTIIVAIPAHRVRIDGHGHILNHQMVTTKGLLSLKIFTHIIITAGWANHDTITTTTTTTMDTLPMKKYSLLAPPTYDIILTNLCIAIDSLHTSPCTSHKRGE